MRRAIRFLVAVLAAMLPFGPSVLAADPFTAMGVLTLTSPYVAPAFTLPSTTGNKVSLESVRGKVVLIYFGASW